MLPRAGVVTVHFDGRRAIADATTAVVAPAGFRVHGGPATVAVVALAADWPRLAPAVHVLSSGHQFLAALRAARPDAPALDLVLAVLSAPVLEPAPRVHAVRALLASAPAVGWTLRCLGREVHASPFHLARQFRAATGHTVGDYLHALRMSAALERLARGERDLARLAAELGFSGHSHLSQRFRKTFGATPSQMRTILTARRALGA